MKTQFKFTSSAFPEYSEGDDALKLGIQSRRLAEFLSTQLTEAGYVVLGIFPESWGWVVELENEDFPLSVSCCNLPDAPNTFICAIDPSTKFVRRWFERIATSSVVVPLGDVVETILSSVTPDLQIQ